MQKIRFCPSNTSKEIENISVDKKINISIGKLKELILWKEYYQNEEWSELIFTDEIEKRYEHLEYIETLKLFDYIKIIEIKNGKIIFSIVFPLDNEDEDIMIEEIWLEDFYNLFINKWIITIKNKEIEYTFQELLELIKQKNKNNKCFIEYIKDKIKKIF